MLDQSYLIAVSVVLLFLLLFPLKPTALPIPAPPAQ